MIVAGLLALIIGALMGLLGGGGSLLTVPILVYWLNVETRQAIASSQLLVAATSLVAVILHARKGNVVWRTGALFSSCSVVGAYLGGRIAGYIPALVLMLVFAIVMLVAAAAMLTPIFKRHDEAGIPLGLGRAACVGLPVGMIAGLLGAGGGFLTVPALNLLAGLPIAQSIGTSLLIIMTQSIAGFLGQQASVSVEPRLVLTLCICSAVGSIGGAQLTGRIPAQRLRRGFGILIALVGIGVLLRQIVALLHDS